MIEPFIRTQAIQISRVDLSSIPQADCSHLQITAASIVSKAPFGYPPLDCEFVTTYYDCIAELEYERYSCFEYEPNFESELSVEDELTLQFTPVDFLLGVKPKSVEYRSIQIRIDSFDVNAWRQQPISRMNSSLLKR